MPLSAANVVQAKFASVANQQTVSVALDNPTTPGGTVIVEMFGPAVWPGMPAGWEFDAERDQMWIFRYCGGPGGETSWSWTWIAATDWAWRVTEFDQGMDPVSPLDASPATNTATGAGVTTLSTGTTGTNNRPDAVALATHTWSFGGSNPTKTVTFSAHTNGFAERDEQRVSWSGQEIDVSWSWLFASATQAFECTATVTNSAPVAGDVYYGMVAVYAATQPVGAPVGVLAVPAG